MATQVKFRRGTTSNMATFTGLPGEVVVDTTKNVVVVHDGSTAGGFPSVTSNNPTFTGNVTLTAISANGSVGTANQVLTSNGSTVYWSTASTGGITANTLLGLDMTGYFR